MEHFGQECPWDARAGMDAGMSWRVYGKNCVGISFRPTPSMTASELAAMITRLSHISRVMKEAT